MKALPASVLSIIHALKQINSRTDNKHLIKIVKESGIDETEFFDFTDYGHCPTKSYGRSTIYQDEHFGIYLMSWNPGDFTGIHDHGHTEWGCVIFFGTTDHRVYKVNGKQINLVRSEKVAKGSIVPVNKGVVHAMGNLSDKPFFTLHIYGSNKYNGTATEDAKLYEPDKKRILITKGPAFLNIESSFCKGKEDYGIEADENTLNDYHKITAQYFDRIP